MEKRGDDPVQICSGGIFLLGRTNLKNKSGQSREAKRRANSQREDELHPRLPGEGWGQVSNAGWRQAHTEASPKRSAEVGGFLVSSQQRPRQTQGRVRRSRRSRERPDAAEGAHLSMSPVIHHLSIFSTHTNENDHGSWWMALCTGEEKSTAIPTALRRKMIISRLSGSG